MDEKQLKFNPICSIETNKQKTKDSDSSLSLKSLFFP